MKRKYVFFILILALWAVQGNAQVQSTVSLTTSIDDNASRNYTQNEDVISQANMDISKAWKSWDWRGSFYYDGYFNHFSDNTDRTFHIHQLGITSQRNVGSANGLFSLGGAFMFRMDKEAYNVYDFTDFSGYANLKLPVEGFGLFYAGYKIRGRSYANLSELSHWEHLFFSRLNFSLPSRTTFILSSELGYKNYVSQVVAEEILPTEEQGQSRGGRGGYNSIVYTEVDNPSVGQWVNSVRISQSLFNKAGLSSYLRGRTNFGEQGRFLTGVDTGYYTEDELYDDRYGYESIETGVMFSSLLPLSTMVRLGYDHYDKTYQRLALDLEGIALPGDIVREDIRKQFWTRLEKPFQAKKLGLDLKLYLEYLKIQNESNDPYYNFEANISTLGMEVNF
ncbi:MAG: hypothetical protein DWQ05_00620 [Calditrichaeota bacterium]|nr:MAG: hypothetical protein DWQ05_00620 [Calditrichota bacterium]